MKVALAQINTVVGDVWGNVEKTAAALERAAEGGADLVAFPELTMTGYPPEDLLLRPSFIRANLDALEEFTEKVPEGVVAAVGFVDLDGDLHNACAVISGGEVLHRYHKRYLPNYGVFDENRYFREGEGPAPILKMGRDLVGLSICEDIWYPAGPAHDIAAVIGGAGAEHPLPVGAPEAVVRGGCSAPAPPMTAAMSCSATWSAARTSSSSTAAPPSSTPRATPSPVPNSSRRTCSLWT